ncbi:hypothetical protein HGM15179_001043, partial [Zosterops borbonicus]
MMGMGPAVLKQSSIISHNSMVLQDVKKKMFVLREQYLAANLKRLIKVQLNCGPFPLATLELEVVTKPSICSLCLEADRWAQERTGEGSIALHLRSRYCSILPVRKPGYTGITDLVKTVQRSPGRFRNGIPLGQVKMGCHINWQTAQETFSMAGSHQNGPVLLVLLWIPSEEEK